MRNALKWAALLGTCVAVLMLVGYHEHVATAMLYATSIHPMNLAMPALAGLALTTEVLPGVTLTSKNRAANELRAQAKALQDEILDTSKPMTKDELEKKAQGIRDLNQRAQMIAEFTGDDEIRRSGDDPKSPSGMVAVDAPENGKRKQLRLTMEERIKEITSRVKDEFGDVRSFMKIAVSGAQPPETDGHRKMIQEVKTLTRAIVGTAGDVSGGEYLLPLTQVQTIFSLANVQQGLLQRARAYNVPGRTLRIPYLVQTDEAASTELDRPMAGNIANVTIIGEASTKAVRQPKFGQRLLTVFKYAAYTQVGDELLADDFTGELPQEFINAVGQQALNKVNEDITIDGAGTTEPDGALKAGAAWTIAVTRNTSSQIKTDDIFNMYERHTHGPNSVWLASRRTMAQLMALSLTSSSLVTWIPNLREAPTMMLLGYPVVMTDLLPTLGSAGDIALVNPDFYAFALRQALTVELSREFAFIEDLTTYRFVVRGGGIPINTGKYAYKYTGTQGVDEHSPFVYLNS